MAVELYPHNQQTYERMLEMFKTSNRVGIVQPTGTGKSFIYLKWIEDHPNDLFTILSPSTEIFTQLQEYAEASGSPDLLKSVQMISYQALLRMTDEEVQIIHSDKMVIDEFHRTGAELWGPSLLRLLDANPNAQVLGASATPVRYLDEGKDMASELFNRNLAVEMTLGEAVQRKILPTPVYVPVWYDFDDKLSRYQDDISSVSDAEKRKELQEKLYQLKRRLESSYGAEDIFRKYIPHDHGKFIVFCRNQEHLVEMQAIMQEWLFGVNANIRSYVSISAAEDKDLQLQAFKADKGNDAIKLLFTIDRLNEGLHVKGIDGVIMLRPTISPIIYLQQMGRALSVGHEKPLIFDMVNNYQNVQIPLGNGVSANVFEREFREAMEKNEDVSSFRVFEDMLDFISLFADLESKLYLSFDEKWEQHFELLKRFIAENGFFPCQDDVIGGFKIGYWCLEQRISAKKPSYPVDRREKLLSIGFVFDDLYDYRWDWNFELLKQFVAEKDRFPRKSETYKGVKLGYWYSRQKQAAKKPSYPASRREKLLSIGFEFDYILDNRWERHFELLKRFVAEKKRFPQQREVYDGFKIAGWCNFQKAQAKKANFPQERRDKLMAIGLLEDTLDSRWARNFELLKQFMEDNGCYPKTNEVYKGVKLGYWYSHQKQAAQKPTYPSDRREKLISIGLLQVKS